MEGWVTVRWEWGGILLGAEKVVPCWQARVNRAYPLLRLAGCKHEKSRPRGWRIEGVQFHSSTEDVGFFERPGEAPGASGTRVWFVVVSRRSVRAWRGEGQVRGDQQIERVLCCCGSNRRKSRDVPPRAILV